jgi:hypothetical protein
MENVATDIHAGVGACARARPRSSPCETAGRTLKKPTLLHYPCETAQTRSSLAETTVCPPCKSARAPLGPNHAVPGHTTTVIDANSATRQVSLRIGQEKHAAMRSYLQRASLFLPISSSKPRRSHSAPLGAALGAMPIGVGGGTVGGRGVRCGAMGAMPLGVDGATIVVGGGTVGGRGILIGRRGTTVGGPCAPCLSASVVPPSADGENMPGSVWTALSSTVVLLNMPSPCSHAIICHLPFFTGGTSDGNLLDRRSSQDALEATEAASSPTGTSVFERVNRGLNLCASLDIARDSACGAGIAPEKGCQFCDAASLPANRQGEPRCDERLPFFLYPPVRPEG